MIGFLKPAKHINRLPKEKIDSQYKKLRWQIYLGIFLGYAAYYLVRNNFALAMPDLIAHKGYTKTQLGIVLSAISVSYGFSKFLMGTVSDRSNPKYFLTIGLIMSALIMLCMGYFPWATSSVTIMFILMFLNGWVQGMGWPPCGRTMVHWWSTKERGSIVATWNTAHNVGGGLVGNLAAWGVLIFGTWQASFYTPAYFALVVAAIVFFLMRDTPQSCGLPPIEEYKNDYPENYSAFHEKEFNTKQILIDYVLKNKFLWYIAIANAFVYFVRYGVLDWAPTYLREAKGFSINKAGWAYALYEYAGIPGTILCGWMSDKIFGGRRAPAGVFFMIGVLIAVIIYYLSPATSWIINSALIAIGFLIYGPVMLIGLHALDLVPKKAAGTAAGFTGFFGYVAGSVFASAAVGYIVDVWHWTAYFLTMMVSIILAIFFIALTWKHGAKIER